MKQLAISGSNHCCYLVHYILLCAAWFLCLAVYYPGVGMNDGLNILAGRLASANQFPIWYCVYVVILGHIGNALGSLQYAIAIYSVLQILITAAICAGIISWIYSKATSRILRILISAYYILNPILAIYAISMLKDTMFSAALVAYGILLYELHRRQGNASRTIRMLYLLMALLVATLRSNGLYIIIVCLFLQWLTSRSTRRLTATAALLVLVATLTGNAIMNHYDVRHNASETLGIPIQQISAVVANDGTITDDELETLAHFIAPEDAARLYTPSTADPVKWSDAFHRQYLNNHVGEFLGLWAHLLPRNFSIYVRAYLQQTYWFWAPDNRGNVSAMHSIETIADNDWLADFLADNGIHDAPLLNGRIGAALRSYFGSSTWFPREGVCLWIMVVSMVVAVRYHKRSRRQVFLLYLPQILCWLTIMVSTPVNESFRYVLYYAYALPLYALFLLHSGSHNHI